MWVVGLAALVSVALVKPYAQLVRVVAYDPAHPYWNMVRAVVLGAAAGLALAVVIAHIPWVWLQFTIAFALLAAVAAFCVRELRWVRRMQRTLTADGEKLAALLEEARRR